VRKALLLGGKGRGLGRK